MSGWAIAAQAATELAKAGFDWWSTDSQKRKEYERQKEFAQNGIQWRVADAKKAGLHPLYALGASTAQYSPQAIVSSGLGDFGQNIGSAVEAYLNKSDIKYAKDQQKETAELDLENKRLQNEQLRQQIKYDESDYIAKMLQNSSNALSKQPGNPISLGGRSSNPNLYTTPQNLRPTSGPVNTGDNLFEFGQSERPGVWRLLPTNDYAQKFEDKIILEYAPFADAWRAGGFQGKTLQGMIYSPLHHGWIRADSKLALDLRDFLKEKDYNRKRKSQEILERH